MLLTSAMDKANRTRGVKSVWVWPGGQMGLPGSEVKSGWRAGCGADSRSANTACCHKHNRYMSGLGPWESAERRMCEERGRKMVKEVGLQFSQCCDMFVMFSHWGDSQTFHFAVWHLTPAAQCGTAVISPDKVGKEEIRMRNKVMLHGDKSHPEITASLHDPDGTLDHLFNAPNLNLRIYDINWRWLPER